MKGMSTRAQRIPLWDQYFDGTIVISTCGLLSNIDDLPDEADLVVQYLHTIKYQDPTIEARTVIEGISTKYKNIVFVTAYKQVERALLEMGINAVFVPMTIDTSKLPDPKPVYDKKIICFGNIRHVKKDNYKKVRRLFLKHGWEFDILSNNTYKGEKLSSQQEVWSIVSQYKYGMGIGRCALEMLGMDMQVVIIGADDGGAMFNNKDYRVQERTNFNGLNNMYDYEYSIKNISKSIIRTSDIIEQLPRIETKIIRYLESIE